MSALRVVATGAILALAQIGATAQSPCETDPFADAAFVPQGVRIYLHVHDAARIRKQLADRPIAAGIQEVLSAGELPRAWSRLAKAAGLELGELFDAALGQEFTFISRGGPQWTLIARAPEARIGPVLQRLKPQLRAPCANMAVCELPEQEVLLARDGVRLVIGPAKSPELFWDLLPRLGGAADSLLGAALDPGVARELGAGCAGVFIRHDRPLGGWSAAVAQLRGDQIIVRHAGHFLSAPFSRGVTQVTCDFSLLSALEQRALLVIIQPTDMADGRLESFLEASLGVPLLSRPMRDNLGGRRVLVLGEVDGRQLKPPEDALTSSIVACLEVKDRGPAVRQLDEHMQAVALRIQGLNRGSMLIEAPDPSGLPPTQPRQAHLGDAATALIGGFPVMRSVSLNWAVVDGETGSWSVIATHPQSLEEIARALRQPAAAEARLVGRFENCGSGNGLRISRHLQSWSSQVERLAPGANVQDLRATLHIMAELAGGIERCRWQLTRPTVNDMRLNVQLQLAPPASTPQRQVSHEE